MSTDAEDSSRSGRERHGHAHAHAHDPAQDLRVGVIVGLAFAALVSSASVLLPAEARRVVHCIAIGGAAGVYCGSALVPGQPRIRLVVHGVAFAFFSALSLLGVFNPLWLAAAWALHGCYDMALLFHVLPARWVGAAWPVQRWYLIACAVADLALAAFIATVKL